MVHLENIAFQNETGKRWKENVFFLNNKPDIRPRFIWPISKQQNIIDLNTMMN